MANFNSVMILGRLTRDPELRYANSGAPVCTFCVATSRKYTKSDGQKGESTTFVDVDVWRRAAELCSQFLKKGREVLVVGSLKLDQWLDSKTKQKRSKLKIVARNVQFLGPKPSAGAEDAEETENAGNPETEEVAGKDSE